MPRILKFFIIAMAAVLPLTLVVPTSARPRAAATLTVSPEAPVVGDSLLFSGCGYEAGVGVSVVVTSPTATSFFGGMAGSDGCFSTSTIDFPVYDPGQYSAAAYQSHRRRADATLAFTVTN